MRIEIAGRMRPFSHRPGVRCLIPKTDWVVEVFPTRLQLEEIALTLSLKGPVREFTVEQDLEKGALRVFGVSQEGYFRYLVYREGNEILLCAEKAPIPLFEKTSLPYTGAHFELRPMERLSLGEHKAQDWDLVLRRMDLKEILPTWFHLGQLTPRVDNPNQQGALLLLARAQELLATGDRMQVLEPLSHLLLCGFSGILAPHLKDQEHHGILETGKEAEGSALPLLVEGAAAIRALFFREEGGGIAFLPCLPPPLHCGRFVGVTTSYGDVIDLEWSKKLLRRVVLRPAVSRSVELRLQKEIQSFRLRRCAKEKGRLCKRGDRLELCAGETYFLDRFQK